MIPTVNLLKDFQVKSGNKKLAFPKTEFEVNITADEDGAVFNIEKNGSIAAVNVCRFGDGSNELIEMVRELSKQSYFKADIIRLPDLEHYIYTIIIDPLCLHPVQLMIAAEVELYIWYSIFLARTNSH